MEILEQKTQSTWERQREQNNNLLQKRMNTLYVMYLECASIELLDKSTHTARSIGAYLNAHKWAPTLTPKYIPSRNIYPTTSHFTYRSGLLFAHPVFAPSLCICLCINLRTDVELASQNSPSSSTSSSTCSSGSSLRFLLASHLARAPRPTQFLDPFGRLLCLYGLIPERLGPCELRNVI